jgi:hypothetical protein
MAFAFPGFHCCSLSARFSVRPSRELGVAVRPVDQTITRIQLESAVILASYGGLAERLEDAPEPFWRHVRDALRARQASMRG